MDLKSTDNLPVMFHAIDKDGKIIFANKRWLNTLGYELSEVLGKSSTDFLSETSQHFAKEVALPLFFKHGSIKDLPYEMVTKSGSIVFVLLSATSQSNEQGDFSHSMAFSTDVTNVVEGEICATSCNSWVIDPYKVHLRLRAIRRNRNLTQEQMSIYLNVSLRTYQRLESSEGQPNVDNVINLLKKLNITPQQFFTTCVRSRHLGYTDVLLVESDPQTATLHKEYLNSFGLNVTLARNGAEALEIFRKNSFHVVLTEIEMPVMDGITLIKELENQPQEFVPEIFIVSKELSENAKEQISFTKTNFIAKPATIENFESKLCRRYII